jgi:hypothetical protein
MDSVRVLLALAATRGWNVHHLDVKSAFLNDELEEVVFVRQPPGFFIPGQEHMVLRLKKALYTRRSRRGLLIVGVYVDDLIVTGESEDDAAEFKREMMKKFKMSDLGLLLLSGGRSGAAGELHHHEAELLRAQAGGAWGSERLQALPDPHGGEAEALQGEHGSKSKCNRLPEHDRGSALPHTQGRISDLQSAISADSWRIPGGTTSSPSKDSSATWLGQSIMESCTPGGRGRSCS